MRRIPRPSPATVIASIALIVAVGGTAYATGEGKPLLGGARNPGSDTTKSLTKETQIIANVSKYGTRQSNKSSSGGGAIYGCRSGAGGTAANNEPCIRANNLSNGLAFEFVATGGDTAGLIQTKDANGKPFTTNATGVATGLNADRVDSLDAEQIVTNARAGYTPLKSLAFSSATASNADEATARAAATEVALLQFGPFTIYGKCFVDTDAGPGATPQVSAETFVRTTQDGALFDGQINVSELDGDPAFLNTGTAEAARTIDSVTADTGADNRANLDGDEDTSALVAPDNQAFEFRMIVGAKIGALPAGNGIWGDGDRCAFGFSRFSAS
jgi:hypothetical protein